MPQKVITLNIICLSHLHQQLFNQFHIAQYFKYDTNPIGHPVTCVVSKIKSTDRLYFSPPENPGWYIGTTLEH